MLHDESCSVAWCDCGIASMCSSIVYHLHYLPPPAQTQDAEPSCALKPTIANFHPPIDQSAIHSFPTPGDGYPKHCTIMNVVSQHATPRNRERCKQRGTPPI